MPSWTELTDYLARADSGLTRLHDDPRVAHLHRTTTGRKARPEVLALAFDHRAQFDDLMTATGAGPALVGRFKALVAAAVRRLAPTTPGAGVVLDDRFGRDALFDLTGSGLWIARPVEQPGVVPLEFEAGPDPAITLRAWPAEHVAKVLVAYRADDPVGVRSIQEERLLRLYNACLATNRELLVEVVPPGPPSATAVAAAIARLYAIGLRPDWWKLQPFAVATDWRAVGEVVRAGDPYCRGILVLGQGAAPDQLAAAFAATAGEPTVRGFAVGRSVFWAVAEQWFAGAVGDQAATDAIAAGYAAIVDAWRRRSSLT